MPTQRAATSLAPLPARWVSCTPPDARCKPSARLSAAVLPAVRRSPIRVRSLTALVVITTKGRSRRLFSGPVTRRRA
jgi:hypothetical protein